MARHSPVPPARGNLPGGNLRAIGVAGLGCWILEFNYGYAGFRVVRDWSGEKAIFLLRSPRRDFATSCLCREFVVVGFAQFESRVSS